MSISIITPVLNAEATLADTFKSICEQRYKNIEHIVVDGGSTDGTVRIIKSYEANIAEVIREPDRGIYDAMNKGLRAATGDVIGLLNSDDMLAGPDVLGKVMQAFDDPEVEAVYGDLVYVDCADPSKIRRVWRSGCFSPLRLQKGWYPAHPALYLRRSVYEKYGFFDLDYPLAADVEFMMRIFQRGVNARYIPEVLVRMRTGGTSGRCSNLWQQNRAVLRGMRKNGIPVSPLFWPAKVMNRGMQFLRGVFPV